MTKQQFTSELTKALASIDHETRAEIMADMNDHFDEGISLGLSEEEICKKLGQPGQIAEQVIEELGAIKSHMGHDGYGQSGQSSANNFADSINNLVGGIGDLVGDIGNMVNEKLQDIDFGDFGSFTVDNNGQHMKFGNFEPVVVDLQNMGETTRVRGGYELNIDETFNDVKSLDIALNLCNLTIAPAPQGESARVIIQGRSRYNNFMIENKNGCLTIVERHPIFKFELFNFKSTLKAMIYLPTSFNGDIRAKTSVGNIAISNLCGDLEFNASAGTINVENHKGNEARLRSAAGSVKLVGCSILNVDAKSSAGGVSFDGRDTDNLILDSSAGAVTARVERVMGETKLSSSAGTVRFEAREIQGNVTVKSSAGGVHIRLPKDVNCRIEVKKPSIGSVKNYLTGNPQSPYLLQVSTSIGSLKLEAMD